MPPNEDEDQQNAYSREEEEEDDDEDEDLEGEESDDDVDEEEEEEEEDLTLDSPSTSSDDPINKNSTLAPETLPTTTTTIATATPTTPTTPVVSVSTITTTNTATATTTIATSTVPNIDSQENKRPRIDDPSIVIVTEEKKPSTLDDSRRLFQRLWTDEDEIGLLQGFLDYTKQRGHKNSSHHHDTAPFYDQIKTKLQLDFNKNQLVEKLRRLKKKYRNVMARISSGKDLSFKSPHDQATFEISNKIWGDAGTGIGEAGVEEDEGNPQNVEINHQGIGNNGVDINDSDKKVPRSRKRSRKRTEEPNISNFSNPSNLSNIPVNLSIPSVIEDTVRSCLSPLFKELLHSAINGPCNMRGIGGMALNPLPLNFGGNSSMNLLSGEMVDEKWRKQQILELEVYSKRMELVQDQIKLALEELRSIGG